MKFWTVQRRELVDKALREGEYQPELELSYYVGIKEELGELYETIRNAFCNVNGVEVPGLVFAYTKMKGDKVSEFSDIDDFRAYMKEHKESILSLWKYFKTKDRVIVELDVPEDFNPIYVDINDFQFLMPPLVFPAPYTPWSYWEILGNINGGVIGASIYPSGLGQAHLPSIKKEHIVEVYEMFDI